MHISLLYQHLIIYSIICISGITGEFFTLSGIAIAAGIAYFSPSIINSKFLNGFGGGEACTDKFIQSSNVRVLEEQLKQHVHGQELAISHICGALKNHFQNRYHNTKALAISLHGLPGTGKNYVTDFIVSSIFKRYKDKGTSRFVHKFNSRIHFPNENHVSLYRLQLTNWIISNVTACDRAIFIFDEVDKFPKGLLDVIIPFIDHHAVYNQISFQNTIFLFLSNSGGTEIMNTFLELRKSGWLLSGKSRSDLNLNDFEQLTKIFAYNENGGFQHSEVIQHNVIDHYIPFLPLEKDHVIKCIENEYNYAKQINYQVSSMVSFDDLKESVLGGMTFIPPEYIFSSSGCKRVKSKVGTYLSRLGIYY